MNSRHRAKGVSSVELIAGCLVLTPLVLLSIDVASIFSGVSIASQACRDAARCAASGMPADISGPHSNAIVGQQAPPYQRAQAALSNYHTNNKVVYQPAISQMRETIDNPVPTQPVFGPVIGQVTVSINEVVAPPFTLAMFPETVTLTSTQTFPYTYVISPAVP